MVEFAMIGNRCGTRHVDERSCRFRITGMSDVVLATRKIIHMKSKAVFLVFACTHQIPTICEYEISKPCRLA